LAGEPDGGWWRALGVTAHTSGKRRGHGEDSIYWDESRKRYIGAVDLGLSPAGTRIRKKVSGKTKVEVREKLRALHKEVDVGLRPRRRATPWATRSRTGWRTGWTGCRRGP
jgi:hypothetical protein